MVAPISSISGAVEHAWTEVFGHESYVQDQPLNETGGDSLDKVRMWLSIEKMLGGSELDMVVVCTPSGLHPAHGIAAGMAANESRAAPQSHSTTAAAAPPAIAVRRAARENRSNSTLLP